MRSNRYKKLPKNTKELKSDEFKKLLPIIKKNCTTKFDESIDRSVESGNPQKPVFQGENKTGYIFSRFLSP